MVSPDGKPAVCWADPTQVTKCIFDTNLGVTNLVYGSKVKQREKREVIHYVTIAKVITVSTVRTVYEHS